MDETLESATSTQLAQVLSGDADSELLDRVEMGLIVACIALGGALNVECLWRSVRKQCSHRGVHASFHTAHTHLCLANLAFVLGGYGVSQVAWMGAFWVSHWPQASIACSGTAATCCAAWSRLCASLPSALRPIWSPS